MSPDEPHGPDEDRIIAYYIAAAAALEGLPLEAAWRSSIAAHFKALQAAARKVGAASLDETVEAAPIFQP